MWNKLVNLTGCTGAADVLSCMRAVDTAKFTAAVNASAGHFGPVYDGDFVETQNSVRLQAGNFVKMLFLLVGGMPNTAGTTHFTKI
ncbi:hypothetical protein SBRCBS47491_005945 [Sporothrix bragantina]|uniref:Carboxylesterase type B domain-containing protein n=1 Tax=Sporothrix bragantina TaxID=671064 RepID=A0ABP0C347_9PEZI